MRYSLIVFLGFISIKLFGQYDNKLALLKYNGGEIEVPPDNYNTTEFGLCNPTVCLEGEELFEVYIKTDSSPSESTWSLVNEYGQNLNRCSAK